MLRTLVQRAASNHAPASDLCRAENARLGQCGEHDYARRMPPELPLELTEIPMAHRGKNPDIPRLMQRESDAILTAVGQRDRVIALEVGGRPWSTEKIGRASCRERV